MTIVYTTLHTTIYSGDTKCMTKVGKVTDFGTTDLRPRIM